MMEASINPDENTGSADIPRRGGVISWGCRAPEGQNRSSEVTAASGTAGPHGLSPLIFFSKYMFTPLAHILFKSKILVKMKSMESHPRTQPPDGLSLGTACWKRRWEQEIFA